MGSRRCRHAVDNLINLFLGVLTIFEERLVSQGDLCANFLNRSQVLVFQHEKAD